MPKAKVVKKAVSPEELLELYKQVHADGGTMAEVAAQYRELSNTQATDQSIKSSISNRISELRQDLVSRGLSKDQTLTLIPKFSRQNHKAERNASAINNLFGDQIATMLAESEVESEEN